MSTEPATCSPDLAADIRHFYLSPKKSYSLDELARLWRVTVDDVRDIFADDLAASFS